MNYRKCLRFLVAVGYFWVSLVSPLVFAEAKALRQRSRASRNSSELSARLLQFKIGNGGKFIKEFKSPIGAKIRTSYGDFRIRQSQNKTATTQIISGKGMTEILIDENQDGQADSMILQTPKQEFVFSIPSRGTFKRLQVTDRENPRWVLTHTFYLNRKTNSFDWFKSKREKSVSRYAYDAGDLLKDPRINQCGDDGLKSILTLRDDWRQLLRSKKLTGETDLAEYLKTSHLFGSSCSDPNDEKEFKGLREGLASIMVSSTGASATSGQSRFLSCLSENGMAFYAAKIEAAFLAGNQLGSPKFSCSFDHDLLKNAREFNPNKESALMAYYEPAQNEIRINMCSEFPKVMAPMPFKTQLNYKNLVFHELLHMAGVAKEEGPETSDNDRKQEVHQIVGCCGDPSEDRASACGLVAKRNEQLRINDVEYRIVNSLTKPAISAHWQYLNNALTGFSSGSVERLQSAYVKMLSQVQFDCSTAAQGAERFACLDKAYALSNKLTYDFFANECPKLVSSHEAKACTQFAEDKYKGPNVAGCTAVPDHTGHKIPQCSLKHLSCEIAGAMLGAYKTNCDAQCAPVTKHASVPGQFRSEAVALFWKIIASAANAEDSNCGYVGLDPVPAARIEYDRLIVSPSSQTGQTVGEIVNRTDRIGGAVTSPTNTAVVSDLPRGTAETAEPIRLVESDSNKNAEAKNPMVPNTTPTTPAGTAPQGVNEAVAARPTDPSTPPASTADASGLKVRATTAGPGQAADIASGSVAAGQVAQGATATGSSASSNNNSDYTVAQNDSASYQSSSTSISSHSASSAEHETEFPVRPVNDESDAGGYIENRYRAATNFTGMASKILKPIAQAILPEANAAENSGALAASQEFYRSTRSPASVNSGGVVNPFAGASSAGTTSEAGLGSEADSGTAGAAKKTTTAVSPKTTSAADKSGIKKSAAKEDEEGGDQDEGSADRPQKGKGDVGPKKGLAMPVSGQGALPQSINELPRQMQSLLRLPAEVLQNRLADPSVIEEIINSKVMLIFGSKQIGEVRRPLFKCVMFDKTKPMKCSVVKPHR